MLLRMLCHQKVHTARRLAVACSSKVMCPHGQQSNSKPTPLLQTTDCISTNTSSNIKEAAPARNKIVIITGPTAVGKTKLGLELAKHIGGEIISADSVQVYQGLDVGSDKLPVEQRDGIPHHLLDILPPDAEFSAGDFSQLARSAAEDILSRGKVPIVVGGTGFYLRWFIHGKAATPPSTPESAAKATTLIQQAWKEAAAAVRQQQQRHADVSSDTHVAAAAGSQQHADIRGNTPPAAVGGRLNAQPFVSPEISAVLSDEQRWDVAADVITQLGDPDAAQRVRVERNNWYRLQRVLQILLLNGGQPLSEMDIDTTKPLEYDFRCFFLHRPRLVLYDRIVYRIEEMVQNGLLHEALMLLDIGMTANSSVATKAIGYRQASEFMQTAIANGGATRQQLQQLIFDIATASRNLVKNQTTWFRDDTMFRWVEVGGRTTDDVLQEVLYELGKPEHEGGCGDSGRLSKDVQRALKRYKPKLKLFNDEQRVGRVLDWVEEVAQSRRPEAVKQQQGVGTPVKHVG